MRIYPLTPRPTNVHIQLPRFPLPCFPSLLLGATFSTLAFFTPAFSAPPQYLLMQVEELESKVRQYGWGKAPVSAYHKIKWRTSLFTTISLRKLENINKVEEIVSLTSTKNLESEYLLTVTK